MRRTARADGLAVIRASVDRYPSPLIRILLFDDLFSDASVSRATTSADEAARLIDEWLRRVTFAEGADRIPPMTPR